MLRIFGAKRKAVTREWRKLRIEQLNDLYSSPNIIRGIKLKRMRLAEHVAREGESRGVYRVFVGQPEGKRPLGRPRLDERMILMCILREWDVRVWTGLIWLRIGTGGGHFSFLSSSYWFDRDSLGS
jgi:hypothetical protein